VFAGRSKTNYVLRTMSMRHTIAREVAAEGITLHTGTQVRMMLAPANPGAGIVFRRADLDGAEVPARYDAVAETNLGTLLAAGRATVDVVEHLMRPSPAPRSTICSSSWTAPNRRSWTATHFPIWT